MPIVEDEPEDTNDDFCFRCGGGGDLLLCDKCDRCAPIPPRAYLTRRASPPASPLRRHAAAQTTLVSFCCRTRRHLSLSRLQPVLTPRASPRSSYHLYCVDTPLDVAPEGEWACQAHRPGARGSRKKVTELLQLEDRTADRGMRHNPARVDAKYQIGPTPMFDAAGRAEEAAAGLGDAAGSRSWVNAKCDDAQLIELAAFTHQLVGEGTGSEERFNEHQMCAPPPPSSPCGVVCSCCRRAVWLFFSCAATAAPLFLGKYWFLRACDAPTQPAFA